MCVWVRRIIHGPHAWRDDGGFILTSLSVIGFVVGD